MRELINTFQSSFIGHQLTYYASLIVAVQFQVGDLAVSVLPYLEVQIDQIYLKEVVVEIKEVVKIVAWMVVVVSREMDLVFLMDFQV